jgi:hypothetical protein
LFAAANGEEMCRFADKIDRTHPKQGREQNHGGHTQDGPDYTFDRVPLFDYDLSGIEFSIFYEDRARDVWGTPTGFLYRLV